MRTSRGQFGFSMMEILITVLLISISLLGMLAMQAQSIAFTQDSVQRNKAAMLAEELMEMLRSDRDEVIGANGFPRETSDYYKAAGASFDDAPDSCVPLPTAPALRLACWAERAEVGLPDAGALLDSEYYIRPNGSTIDIQVAWRVKEDDCLDVDAPEDGDRTICRYQLRAEL